MSGTRTRVLQCADCREALVVTVYAASRTDPGVIDRFRLAAGASGWCIDFDDQPWCPQHRPVYDGNKRVR